MKPKDNEANMQNANLGSNGTNRQYDQVHGNRSMQLPEISHEERISRMKDQIQKGARERTRLGLDTYEGRMKALGFSPINRN
ncbi:hypothetical protein H8K33_08090 [Undibacterium amnicola]|uniref:Uncharacterized protein n=1 Tax=Undibacterium amnicola TaxID=1834038 RepID=A0ABR6XPW1_9BURK|nr:hypothetical protein [Undibacterium amnicola]MBC3831466.1 hypothetical protein [Undibacterium amnicola]